MGTNRRTNHRSARAKKQKNDALRVMLAVLLGIACVYFALATAAGKFIAEQVIAPVFRSIAGQDEQDSPLSLSPAAPVDTTAKSTAQIKIAPQTYYGLSAGAFASIENANDLASTIQARSGGGYVHHDGTLHRVLIAVYPTESDARSVKEQLLAVNDLESTLYKITVPEVTMRVTADEVYLTAIQSGFSTIEQVCAELCALCENYDAGSLTETEVRAKLTELSAACTEPAAVLSGTGSDAADDLCALLSEISENLSALGANNTENSLAFSAALKYNQVETICSYSDLVRKLANQ